MRTADFTAFIRTNMRADLAGRSLVEWELEWIDVETMRLEAAGEWHDGNPAAMALWERREQLETADYALAV